MVKGSYGRRRTAATSVAFAVVSALMITLSGCASDSDGADAGKVSLPADPLAAAKEWARQDNGGKQIGGSLTIVGVNSGVEGEQVKASFKPFEEATGITVDYQGTHDANTVVATRLAAGNPPDVYKAATAGGFATYQKAGQLIPLNDILDMNTVKAEFPSQLLDAMSSDGKLYGIFNSLDTYGIWYNAKTYKGPTSPKNWDEVAAWSKERAASGTTPWCMTMGQAAGTGSVAAHFIGNLLLTEFGPEKLQAFSSGKLPFTSPEVTAAFKKFGEIATDPKMVNGGPTTVLSTPTGQNGDGLFTSPPKCDLMGWGSYAQQLMLSSNPALKAGTDTDFFPYPSEKYSDSKMVSGNVVYAMKDTPQVRAFMRYYASAPAQALLTASGSWLVANKNVSPASLPNDVMKKALSTYQSAKTLVLSPVTVLPPAVQSAYYKATVSFLQDPASLPEILQGVEKIRSGQK
jgi:alpha-glucoside transport system substrate-binding protein